MLKERRSSNLVAHLINFKISNLVKFQGVLVSPNLNLRRFSIETITGLRDELSECSLKISKDQKSLRIDYSNDEVGDISSSSM